MALVGATEARDSGIVRSIPYDRISPLDLYQQLDWLRDEWDSPDEYQMTQKLVRLRRTFGRLPTRYYEQAKPILLELGYMRLVRKPPYHGLIVQLRGIVSDWDRSRRKLDDEP